MAVFLGIIAALFTLAVMKEKKEENKKIYSSCFCCTVVGIVFLELLAMAVK